MYKFLQVLMQFNLLVQETRPRRKSSSDMTTLAGLRASPCIHFIETEPSVLRDVPWIQLIAHKVCNTIFSKMCSLGHGSQTCACEALPL